MSVLHVLSVLKIHADQKILETTFSVNAKEKHEKQFESKSTAPLGNNLNIYYHYYCCVLIYLYCATTDTNIIIKCLFKNTSGFQTEVGI